MRKIGVLFWISSLFFLSSCLNTQQLEDLGVITSRGIDLTEDDKVELNMAILHFQANVTSPTTIVTGVSNTIKGALEDANQEISQRLVPGKLQLEIYGREIAEMGINPLTDTLIRDANIPDNTLLAVARGKARDIFHIESTNISSNLGEFLHGLIEPTGETHMFPSISLHRFAFVVNNEGADPILPIISVRDGIPTITGIALFKDDKMKGELPIEDEHLVKMTDRTVRGEFLEISVPIESISDYLVKKEQTDDERELNLVFLIEQGRTKTNLLDKEKLKFKSDVTMELYLQEISQSYKLTDPKAIKQLEKALEKVIEEKYKRILHHLKELNTDSFGYGIYYRIKNEGGKLTDKEWDKKFPNIDVTFNVDVNIIRHGTLSQ